jgi:hypothetical protein
MAYRAGTEELLSRCAENLDRVVDPALRQRLMGQYLGYLQQWHGGVRGKQMDEAIRGLWNQVASGAVQYKLWPGLGTTHGQFYDTRDSALAVLDHLSQLVGRQKNLNIRRRWLAELADMRGQIAMLDREAKMASTNVNLSRLDTLASQASNITAQKLIPRMQEWATAVKAGMPMIDPGGESAAVSIAARPDLWAGTGLGEDQSSSWDAFSKASEGEFSGQTAASLVDAQKKYAQFRTLISDTKALVAMQKTSEGLAAKAGSLQADIDENRRQVNSLVAEVRSLASELAKTPAVDWQTPVDDASGLGESLSANQGAAILLYAGEVDRIAALVKPLEQRITTILKSQGYKSPAGAGMATGVALLGMGVLAFMALRKD